MNINQALNYFKKDPSWKKTYAILLFLPLLGVIPMIGVTLTTIIGAGYLYALTNKRIFKTDVPLIEWDMKKISMTGLKFFGYSALLGLILGAFMMGSIPSLIASASSQNPTDAMNAMLSMTATLYIVFIPMCIIADLATLSFATNLKFASFFKFNAMKFILFDNFVEYAKLCLIKFVIGLVVALSAITIIGPFFLVPLGILLVADLNAQFLRKIFKIG